MIRGASGYNDLVHELAVAQNLLEIVEKGAHPYGGARVSRNRLRIGRLSAVVPGALRFAFEVVSRGGVMGKVRAGCDLLGFDPYYLANEGKLVAFVPEGEAERVRGGDEGAPLGQGMRGS